ncbi:MAG: phosphoesterase [Phycisphaerales bacterium]|nr:phosphoesterase [Phycisphaerales bacterium]
MPQLLRKIRAFFIGKEPLVFVAALLVVLGILAFVFLLDEVREGGTKNFDNRVLRALRKPDDPSKLIGPHGMESVVRDITALGGVVVLLLVVGSVAGFLLLIRRYHMMWLVLVATIGATAINSTIKGLVDRPRPTSVPRLTDVSSESFPSGHSAMSAAVYLTLGGLLAQTVSRRSIKLYFLFIAMTVTFLVGLSRVCLGVHYPTDVLAGWAVGLVWALLCWLVARYLQRRGAIEREEDPTLPESKTS